jgi:predicted enzyme related to lactoylglutathione lyase
MEEAIAKVEGAGGKKVHGPNEIPGIGFQAYCTDTEGNIFGLHQALAKEA